MPGAKNSVLKLMAASLLADGVYELTNVPDDRRRVDHGRAAGGDRCHVGAPRPGSAGADQRGELTPVAPYELVERIRASINVLGPLLTRCGEVRLSMPGGDDFGARPIDMHIAGLEAMGAEFKFAHGELRGARRAAARGRHRVRRSRASGRPRTSSPRRCCADGTTTIDNAAREPEVVDLCEMLVAMGADITGIGSSRHRDRGRRARRRCDPVDHRTVSDRIQAATYLAAVAVAGGELDVIGARPEHMENLLARFTRHGPRVHDRRVRRCGSSPTGGCASIDVPTLPYPGIATDYKPLIITMLSVAEGIGIVTENLYPGRFRYVEELQRLGADIRTTGHHAVVRGVPRLSGAPVRAHDIRAGAAMVVAGLAAEGVTTISGVAHIDRGYDDLVGRLAGVGADIERV